MNQKHLAPTAALFIGAAQSMAFAPYAFWLLALICPALLFRLLLKYQPSHRSWRLGFCFGIGFFGFGVSWTYVAIHTFGGIPPFVAGVITALFIVYLSVFPALACQLWEWLFKHAATPYVQALGFALLLSVANVLRANVLTGFPWLQYGTSWQSSPLTSLLPLLGSYGLGLLLLWSAALLAQSQRAAILGVLLLATLFAGAQCLKNHVWSTAKGAPLRVALVQANILQQLKWSPELAQKSLVRYQTLTLQHPKVDLIVWPEAAIVYPLQFINETLQPFLQTLQSRHQALITGIPIRSDNGQYYNAAIARGYRASGQYNKTHLVPFGEVLPPFLHFLTPIIARLHIPMSNLRTGATTQAPLHLGALQLAPLLCYEVAYSSAVLAQQPTANLLLTLSDDAWFGHSSAMAQHLQIAQLRAVETARPHLMVSNNGLTAAIDPQGKLLAALAPFQEGVLTATVQPRQGATPWVRYGGDRPWFLGIFILLILCIMFNIFSSASTTQGG